MSDEKVKMYKNKERGKAEVRKNYVPQYQLMGIEPEEVKSSVASSPTTPSPQTNDNPRVRRLGIRQPYAEPPSVMNKGPVPNVGNNMEHMWSSVNDEIIDDLSEVDLNHPVIDNNDFVSSAAFGIKEEMPLLDEVKYPSAKKFVSAASSDNDDTLSIISALSEDDYLLIANGVSVCSGPVSEIQEQARLLVFGDHELCDGNPIPVDDIIVIKRVPIRIGLFLE